MPIATWRFSVVQPFLLQSGDQIVVLKPDPSIRKAAWLCLLIMVPCEVVYSYAFRDFVDKLFCSAQCQPILLNDWIFVALNVAYCFVLIYALLVALSPEYRLLTLNKEQVTVVSFFKKVKVFRWADIEKFEMKPAYRMMAIYLKVKSQKGLKLLTTCIYPELQGIELFEILNHWLERYGTLQTE